MEVMMVERTLTELDHVRLSKLIQRHKSGGAASSPSLPIEQVLDEADVVHWRQVPPNVVTMHSRVLVKDPRTGAQSQLTLCYPDGADPRAGFVSVLSPAGWSLLGQKVGATVRWPTPAGDEGVVQILGMLFQPESSGVHAM